MKKKYNFTRKNKQHNSIKRKNKLVKSRKNKKNKLIRTTKKNIKNKNKIGGTFFLTDSSDRALEGIVSMGFEFESETSCYLMYDKTNDEYYLGDTYDIHNDRRKDEKLFQITKFNSMNDSVMKEEFYSQEDENSELSWLNEYFQEQLKYYLERDPKTGRRIVDK